MLASLVTEGASQAKQIEPRGEYGILSLPVATGSGGVQSGRDAELPSPNSRLSVCEFGGAGAYMYLWALTMGLPQALGGSG